MFISLMFDKLFYTLPFVVVAQPNLYEYLNSLNENQANVKSKQTNKPDA